MDPCATPSRWPPAGARAVGEGKQGQMGMDRQTLEGVVALHARWLASGGREGRMAYLEDADLRQADLRGADLSGAVLNGANLERAELAGARLRNAAMGRVNMAYADLAGADLSGANLQRAIASGAGFDDARLANVILHGARLDYARLRRANLTGAVASNTQCFRADLSDTTLDKVDFTGANLISASLAGANISNTDFGEANLRGANLAGARFASDDEKHEVVVKGLTAKPEEAGTGGRLRQLQMALLAFALLGLLVFLLGAAVGLYDAFRRGGLLELARSSATAGLVLALAGFAVALVVAWVRKRQSDETDASAGT
jgi:uncharacterized protein YjbI with pentapeptide repeats